MRNRVDNNADPTRRRLLAMSMAMAAAAPALAAVGRANAAFASPGTGELPPDLAESVSDYDRATVHNDTATLDRLVAEDYVLVNSDSTLQDKQSYLDDFNVPGFRLHPYVIEQPIHKVWGDTALLGGVVHLRWTLDGGDHSRLLRIAHVWARQEGHWRLTYTQLTRVPQ